MPRDSLYDLIKKVQWKKGRARTDVYLLDISSCYYDLRRVLRLTIYSGHGQFVKIIPNVNYKLQGR